MNKLSLRTKNEIIIVTILFILILASSVSSLTRTITDSSDNNVTFIRNSNGNMWEATGANIQVAINDTTYSLPWANMTC